MSKVHQQIIDDLNEIRAKHFPNARGFNAKAYSREIGGRLRDGYTVEDFLVVHRKKEPWLKTAEWAKYYRPSTLYRKCNFDKYLTEIEYSDLPQETKNGITRDQNIREAEERQAEHPNRTEYENTLRELHRQRTEGVISSEEFLRQRDALQASFNNEPEFTEEELRANQKRIAHILDGIAKPMPKEER